MTSPFDRSITRHVGLIATPAQLTTVGSRPRYSLAFADDGTIKSITGADTLVTIPTTGTTASTNLVVEDTGTASVATVLTLSHVLSSGTPAAGIGTGMTYYAQTMGGPIALGSTNLYTTNVGVGTETAVFSLRTRIAGSLANRLTVDGAGDVISEGRLALRNGTAFSATLASTPTADRVLTLPDTTDTLVVSNDPRLLANGEMGAVCIVDQTLGSDLTGSRNGLPFATITAALAATTTAGDCVWIMPGTYNESIVIPTNVAVRGINTRSVTIQKLLVTADTTLVTMGEGSRLEDVNMVLTSAEHHTLVGILWPGTTTATAKLRTTVLTVDNSTAGALGTSNVYGYRATGTGTVAEATSAVRASAVTVRSAGLGAKRGILVSGATEMNHRDIAVFVTNAGGAGSYIGAETTHAGAVLRVRVASVSGASADISQTAGRIELGTVTLAHNHANGLGFDVRLNVNVTPLIYADSGATPSGTRYMRPGTAAVSASPFFVRIPSGAVVRSITVHAATGPGAARTDTWTVQIDGVDTVVSASLTGADVLSTNEAVSAGSESAFDLSVKQVCAASSATSDVAVVVGLY